MKLLQKIRLHRYNSKLEDIWGKIKELDSFKTEIENEFKEFVSSYNNIDRVQQIFNCREIFSKLKSDISQYERKIRFFKTKYRSWYNNCVKLNFNNLWEDEYEDLYTQTLYIHEKSLKCYNENIESLSSNYNNFNYDGKRIK